MNLNNVMFEHFENEYDVLKNDVYVGMKLSGGCDSAIVYYTLCKRYENNDNVNIVVFSLDTSRKPFYSTYAKRVIDIVGNLTNKYPIEHMIKFIEHWPDGGDSSPYSLGQDELLQKANEKYGVEYCYTGLTKNPDHNNMMEYFKNNYQNHGLNLEKCIFNLKKRDQDRDYELKDDINDGYRPFGNKDKLSVAKAYNHYENLGIPLLDLLYQYTDSCEEMDRNLNLMDGQDPVHCGHCYFCLERWYAFGRLI